jgi:tRNA(adenine34) deaminase
MNDEHYMKLALEEATRAASIDEVPVGAVIVNPVNGEIIAAACNETILRNDPTAHAEILAIRTACEKTGAQRIPGFDLYVTLEPCAMCAGAISFARIRRVIYGAPDPKGGGVAHGGKFFEQPTCHHRPEVSNGPMQEECAEILKKFFKTKRSI